MSKEETQNDPQVKEEENQEQLDTAHEEAKLKQRLLRMSLIYFKLN
jgi:hypothetical protein